MLGTDLSTTVFSLLRTNNSASAIQISKRGNKQLFQKTLSSQGHKFPVLLLVC